MQVVSIERLAGAFQRPVSAEQIERMALRALGPYPAPISAFELDGGLYNSTYRVEFADRSELILRVAPAADRQFLIEKLLMRNEHAALPFFAPIAALMPRTVFADWTRQIADRDYLWQTVLDGVPAAKGLIAYPRPLWAVYFRQLGTLARTIHQVKGTRFGPVAGPTFPTWSEAIAESFQDMATDLQNSGLNADDVLAVAGAAVRGRTTLDEIGEPSLLHGDLWVPNTMLERGNAEPNIIGVLDHDRASWGDPAADWTNFVVNQRPGTERDALWETYGAQSNSRSAGWRALIYRARHIGAIRLERHRLDQHDKIAASYQDMQKVLDRLRAH